MAVLTERDHGRTISAVTGERLTIELPQRGAAGYRWSLPRFDPERLALDGDETVSAAGSAIGAGMIRRFVFRVLAPGASQVHVECSRPWERRAEPARRFTLTVLAAAG